MEHVKPKYGVETVTKNLRPPTQTAFNSEEKNLQKSLALVPLSRNGSSLGLLIIQKTTNNPRNLFSYNTNTVSNAHTYHSFLRGVQDSQRIYLPQSDTRATHTATTE